MKKTYTSREALACEQSLAGWPVEKSGRPFQFRWVVGKRCGDGVKAILPGQEK
jgi:hypothetical protein